MKGLVKLLIVGLVAWLVWNYFVPQGTGDRPPIFIVNGPVRLEAQTDGRSRGEFKKGLLGIGTAWSHRHPGRGPSHFEVIVTESSCGPSATYDATELSVRSNGNGTSSNVTISIGGFGPFTYLQVEPYVGTVLTQDSARTPYQLGIGAGDEQLSMVQVGGSSCAFVPGQGSITINQRH